MSHLNPILTPRLIICLLLVILSLILSGIAFYYLHAQVPVIALLAGLMAALPLGVIIEEVRHFLKIKKIQQPHHPPKRS